ncbi:MAG: UDP-N-acetylmuramoyl-tripeptide--D-alanyl-D-alanine ligase [Candidatus Nomurabacteria bacterium]|nr:MAG: UDP-N-acetylmuramoyl-tripeptide--D-alanyl-D-alanine ligase [Candidatus Nomurabacteria bacterium]
MSISKLQQYVQRILAWYARKILAKYQPDVVAITGSVGKTSTKEAIFTVMSGAFAVRRSQGNLNNELGLPLAIIDAKSGGRNPFAWLGIFIKATKLLLQRRPFPEVLILEMGADHPGDISYLCSIARPRVSVVTAVAPVHTEFFGSVEKVAEEKSVLAKSTEDDGYTILNADDERVLEFHKLTKSRVLSYGIHAEADVQATEVGFLYGKQESFEAFPSIEGMRCVVHFEDKSATLELRGSVGQAIISSALAATCVALAYGMDLRDIAEAFRHFVPPRGRTRLLKGQKRSLLIDDSYNASPRAVTAALQLISDLSKDLRHHLTTGPLKKSETIESATFFRRIVVLGDMAELGEYTDDAHAEIGKTVKGHADILVTVGKLGAKIAAAAREAGFPEEEVHEFPDAKAAVVFLRSVVGLHDIVLVKGSQSVRLERVVRELLQDPEEAEELLVRQGREWLRS